MDEVKNYSLSDNSITLKEKEEESTDFPKFLSSLDLTDKEKKRVLKEITDRFDQLKKDRNAVNVASKWDSYERQYGEGKKNTDFRFKAHVDVTKRIIRSIKRGVIESVLGMNPIFTVDARPQLAKNGNHTKLTYDIEDFLDFEMDENIHLESKVDPNVKNTGVLGTGFFKLSYYPRIEKEVDEEVYDGSQFEIDSEGNPVNKGLQSFIECYPEPPKESVDRNRWEKYIEKLTDGEKINIEVEKDVIKDNHAMITNIDPRNLWVDVRCNDIYELERSELIVEKRTFTWRELKLEEKEGRFQDVDDLKKEKDGKDREKYDCNLYTVYECVYYFKRDNKDEAEKIVVFYEESLEIVLGAISYPFKYVPCYYFPTWLTKEEDGIYGNSIADDVKTTNVAQDVILNRMLEQIDNDSADRMVLRKGSTILKQLLVGGVHGKLPLIIGKDEQEPTFVNQYRRPQNYGNHMMALNMLDKNAADATGIGDMTSGEPSRHDPTSPGNKTIALLQVMGVNIEYYVKTYIRAINPLANALLGFYYQITNEGRMFMRDPSRVTGENKVWGEISKSDMRAKVKVYSQAHIYNFDKLNKQKSAMFLYSTIRQEPLIANDAEKVRVLLKEIIESAGESWRSMANNILPPIEQIKQDELMKAAAGVQFWYDKKVAEKKEQIKNGTATDTVIQINPAEILQSVKQSIATVATPPSKEQMKEVEKVYE